MAKKVLFGVLDWGIGHATRSTVLINKCLEQGDTVVIASAGKSLEFLKYYFPQLSFIELKVLNITYVEKFHIWNWLSISYRIFLQYFSDRKLIQAIEREYDLIISDNRYGFISKKIPSYIVTHQLNIIPPKGFGIFAPLVNALNRRVLGSFAKVLVPDFEGAESLAGKLSVNSGLRNLEYLGFLSRLALIKTDENPKYKIYDVLIILSGPEPSRSILEDKLVNLMTKLCKKSLILGGFSSKNVRTKNPFADFVFHLPDAEFVAALQSIPYVIARAGYSTLMDLRVLNKKALIIPTPAQSEQLYLAQYYADSQYFKVMQESDLPFCAKLPDL